MNKTANNIKNKTSKNDVYYTPYPVVKRMIDMCEITEDMEVLDPCYGAGAFFENLPKCNKEWCEIEKGKDFFNETKRYDLIIGNPPYSMWDKWIEHTMKLTDKFCYIFGVMNLTPIRLKQIMNNGYGMTKIEILKIDWWFGSSFLIVFEKYKPSIMSITSERIYCDICNKRCKRGRGGNNVNECTIILKPT